MLELPDEQLGRSLIKWGEGNSVGVECRPIGRDQISETEIMEGQAQPATATLEELGLGGDGRGFGMGV